MSKKGTSIVELIAVIVIMGIIAGITTLTVTTVISRQRKNATINALNYIYKGAINLLLQVEAESYDENISFIDNDFCYVSLTTLIETGNVDGDDYRPDGDEIYFCYDMNSSFVVITDGTITKTKPESTGSTIVNKLSVTFNYESDKFIIA